ncbi:MAG: hypothetical protein WCJ71_03290 [Candidatus Omnitrophota bacterium]
MVRHNSARSIASVIKIVLVLMLAFGFWNAHCYAEDPRSNDYDQYSKNLAAGVEVEASLNALGKGGVDAFPAILTQLHNNKPLGFTGFEKDIVAISPDGSWHPHSPTIGEACFDIIQGQIEGNWPKGFRRFYVLTSDNLTAWLDAHKDQTLEELRVEVRETSLRNAEKELAGKPGDEFLEKVIKFLKTYKKGS